MLIDINLLPKKEKKNFSVAIILSLLSVLFIIGTSLTFYYGFVLKSQAQQLSLKNQQVTESLRQEQEQVEMAQSTNSVVELKKAVEWAQSYPIKSVPVLQHLTSLLPERGFIQQYSYSEDGKVLLTVQFDTSREAAYFLKWLNDSKWIAEANILSLNLGSNNETNTEQTEVPQTEYVPRYIGSFDITLEREKVKELINMEKTEQGGDS
ncbi:PilN domain-containing protein [Neobacillus sp. D3-1R]|uniref:PilN domain-containing protein n=1 Tax=Neobacillus sp. D3-1R TaxID=3445778 RepID=UPI003F9EE310